MLLWHMLITLAADMDAALRVWQPVTERSDLCVAGLGGWHHGCACTPVDHVATNNFRINRTRPNLASIIKCQSAIGLQIPADAQLLVCGKAHLHLSLRRRTVTTAELAIPRQCVLD